MADTPNDDELLLDDPVEPGENDEAAATETSGEEDGEEEVVTFGDEAAPASGEGESSTIKLMREKLRAAQREAAELRKAQPGPQKIEVGPKPTLADCDYDEDAYEQQIDAWKGREAEAKRVESEADTAAREANEAWQNELKRYQDGKAVLTFADAQEAEDTVTAALNQVQQAVIVKVSDNPALVLYSLGKHPEKLTELSKITDPLKLAAAVAKLEGTMKVTKRRKAPEPEEIVRGSASLAAGTDKHLERLEAEAERNGGDRTKIREYREAQRRKA